VTFDTTGASRQARTVHAREPLLDATGASAVAFGQALGKTKPMCPQAAGTMRTEREVTFTKRRTPY
jgi:hypothetical protein